MITLTVYQKGVSTYSDGISMQFSPSYMTKMVTSAFGADGTSTQFEYLGLTYIVAQSVSAVCALITTASTISVAGLNENNITQKGVAFNLPCVIMVENIDGFAGIYWTTDQFKAAYYGSSTANTDFAAVSTVLETYGFVRCQRQLGDGTTRETLINPNAAQEVIAGTVNTPATYIFPNKMQVVGYTLFTYTSAHFTGITTTLETLDTILTGDGTITLGLPMISAPNKLAIENAIIAWLDHAGAQYSSVAVTQPTTGAMKIVVSDTNVIFINGIATINSATQTKTFTAS